MSNKAFWIIIILVLLGGVTYAAWPAIAKKKDDSDTGNGGDGVPSTGTVGTGGTSTGLDYNRVLKNGVRGNEVSQLQSLLNMAEVNSPLVVDGIFGPKTEAKLQRLTGSKSITLATAQALMQSYTKKVAAGSGSVSASAWSKFVDGLFNWG